MNQSPNNNIKHLYKCPYKCIHICISIQNIYLSISVHLYSKNKQALQSIKWPLSTSKFSLFLDIKEKTKTPANFTITKFTNRNITTNSNFIAEIDNQNKDHNKTPLETETTTTPGGSSTWVPPYIKRRVKYSNETLKWGLLNEWSNWKGKFSQKSGWL